MWLCACRDRSRDIRTLDKLYDGVNNSWKDSHMWLAPYSPGKPNLIFIYFDERVTISCLKVS